jgi:hypothetical protein
MKKRYYVKIIDIPTYGIMNKIDDYLNKIFKKRLDGIFNNYYYMKESKICHEVLENTQLVFENGALFNGQSESKNLIISFINDIC